MVISSHDNFKLLQLIFSHFYIPICSDEILMTYIFYLKLLIHIKLLNIKNLFNNKIYF